MPRLRPHVPRLHPCVSQVLVAGNTGTGKTLLARNRLLTLSTDSYQSIFLNYSAQTSAAVSQGIVDGQLDKRRKGVFGPPFGKKCVVFVDDLNMPTLEEYGAPAGRAVRPDPARPVLGTVLPGTTPGRHAPLATSHPLPLPGGQGPSRPYAHRRVAAATVEAHRVATRARLRSP